MTGYVIAIQQTVPYNDTRGCIVTYSLLFLIVHLQLPQKYKQLQTIQRFEAICKLKFIDTLPTSNLPKAVKEFH